MVDIEGFITLGPVARGHHREGTASSAWLLPHEHLGDPPWWSCWRRSTDETGWNCGPVRSGKICAMQIHKHTDTPRPPLGTTTTTTERVRATITSKESEGVGSSLWLLHQHHPRGRCRGLETLMKRAGTRWARAEKFVARTGHAEVLFHT